MQVGSRMGGTAALSSTLVERRVQTDGMTILQLSARDATVGSTSTGIILASYGVLSLVLVYCPARARTLTSCVHCPYKWLSVCITEHSSVANLRHSLTHSITVYHSVRPKSLACSVLHGQPAMRTVFPYVEKQNLDSH